MWKITKGIVFVLSESQKERKKRVCFKKKKVLKEIMLKIYQIWQKM